MNDASHLPTIVGLCIALGGAILPVHRLLAHPDSFSGRVLEQGFLWVLFGLIMAIVIWWEKLPISSVGLGFQWPSVTWGLVLAAVLIFLVSPLDNWILKQIGSPGFESGFAKLANLPVWFLLVAAVTAGVVEETLYRGYAIERLAWFIGSYWWAGLIALTVHALVHVPFWGWGPVLIFFPAGVVITLFYIWKQDLLACMIAHAMTNAVGLVLVPPVARGS